MIDTLCNVVVDSLAQDTIAAFPELSYEGVKGYVTDAINNNEFFQGGMIITILGSIAYYFKSIPLRFWAWGKKFLIYEALVDQQLDGELYDEFNDWYRNTYPEKYRRVQMYMPGKWNEEESRSIYRMTKYQEEDTNLIWRKGRAIWITKKRIRLENASNVSNLFYNEYRISGFFAKKPIDAMFEQIKIDKNEKTLKEKGIKILGLKADGYDSYSSKRLHCYKTFDDLFFDRKDELIEYIQRHKDKRAHYKSKGIKHKTGIRLHGPPGTGKSSIILAIAHEFKMNVCLLNLASFATDEEFTQYISELPRNTIIAFEDIDDFLGKSQRAEKTNSRSYVSFSTILQVLDGIISPENVIFILTTNKPEELDEALYRDGRINKDIEIGLPSWLRIFQYASHYYDVYEHSKITELRQLLGDTLNSKPSNRISMSTVERICTSHDSIENALDEIYNTYSLKDA